MYRKHPNHTYGRNRNNSANNWATVCFIGAELSWSLAQAINSGIYWSSWALLNNSITFFNLSKDNRSITAIKIKDIISFEDNWTSGRPNQKMVKPIHIGVKLFLKCHNNYSWNNSPMFSICLEYVFGIQGNFSCFFHSFSC